MAYIHSYISDIFISYASIDDEKIFEQPCGWVEQFYKDLKVLLLRKLGKMDSINIWWDKRKMDGTNLLDKTIEEGIRGTAILLCLTSPNYLDSEYCSKELGLFYEKAQQEPIGLYVGNRARIINVLLYNIPFDRWPKELSGTIGFPFYSIEEKDDLGDPHSIGSDQYKSQLQKLRNALANLIVEFSREETTRQGDNQEQKENTVKNEVKEKEEKEEKDFTIYIGEVADTLRPVRKRAITDLEKKGYKVVSGIPPPDEAATHEERVKEEIVRADLAVHLLDQIPGREIMGEPEICYPQKQTELGLQFARSQIIWVSEEMNLENVEDEKYKLFIQGLEKGKISGKTYEFIRGTKSSLSKEIIDLAEQLRFREQQKSEKEKISVLLDTHYNDQSYALDLSKILLENDIQPFINPQEDNPRKNINILAERISQVNKLIFFYGKVNIEWVQERMKATLQLIVNYEYQIDDLIIFLLPPYKSEEEEITLKQKILKIHLINNSNHSSTCPLIEADALKQLLNILKA